jgi:hypothetical protein
MACTSFFQPQSQVGGGFGGRVAVREQKNLPPLLKYGTLSLIKMRLPFVSTEMLPVPQ